MPEQKLPEQDLSPQDRPEQRPLLTRRAVLGGLAMGAAAPLLLARVHAQTGPDTEDTAAIPFEPALAASTAAVSLLPRQMHTATALNNAAILVAGGLSGAGAVLSDAVLVMADGSVRPIAPLLRGRYAHAAVLLPHGRVLVLGGQADTGPLAEAEVWDPVYNAWTAVAPLKMPRYSHAAVRTSARRVLVLGGFSQGVVDDIEVYVVA